MQEILNENNVQTVPEYKSTVSIIQIVISGILCLRKFMFWIFGIYTEQFVE